MLWTIRFRLREYLATNLWVLPMVFTLGGYLFAVAVTTLDRHVAFPISDYEPDTAISLLSAMFAGVVTFIGFVITIVLLVPQFASSQFSPRILAIWFRRSPINLALSFFFFAAGYVFTVLGRVHGGYVPRISITLAAALVFAGFGFFLWFMSRFAIGLRPATMADIVAQGGRQVIERTYPLRDSARADEPAEAGPPEGEPVFSLVQQEMGRYVRGIDLPGMVRLARRLDGVVVLHYAVGEYVRIGGTLVEVFAARPPRAREVEQLVVLGTERTLEQDPAYALRILVDVAVKALSSAINDPTTAVQALDRISDLLHLLAVRDFGDGHVRDAAGRVRVVMPVWTWEDYLRLGTREVVYFGRDSLQVARRLRAMLQSLSATAAEDRRPAIEREMDLLERLVARGFVDAEERATAREADFQGLGIGHAPGLHEERPEAAEDERRMS